MSIDSSNAVQVLQSKINDLTNVLRITQNTINLINGSDVKGGDAPAVTELLNYHNGFANNIKVQMEALQASLPKKEEEKVIVPEVVGTTGS